MDTTKFDLSRLDREEKFELRALQKKERDVNGDLEKFTVEELRQYGELLRKLQGLPSAYAHIIDPDWPNGEHHTLKTPRHPKPYVPVIAPWHKSPDSGVPAASEPAQPAEPVAIAPAAAPAKPVAPATPAPAEKPKRPAEDVVSAHRALDAILRFGG